MLPNNRFEGELNGKKIEDFTNQLDFDLESTRDRINKVKEILYTQGVNKEYVDEFFELFFDQGRTPKPYFDVNIGTTGYTSEFNNICKQLEHMINYILFNKETSIENDESEYPYLTNTDKRRIQKREVSYEQLLNKQSSSEETQIQNKGINKLGTKKYPRMSITKEDREQIPYIAQLQETIDKLLIKLEDESITEDNKYKIKRMITDLRKEQVVIKVGVKKPIEFNAIMGDKPHYDLSSDTGYYNKDGNYTFVSENRINMFNPDHIYHLIEKYSSLKETSYDDFDNEIKFMLWELEELIDNAELKNFERDIILWKIDGLLAKSIIERMKDKYDLEWSEPYLTKAYKNICKKVAEYSARSYENWFYTNKAKGEYKKCSKCGGIKIANRHNFSPDKSKKDGFKGICKECRSKK